MLGCLPVFACLISTVYTGIFSESALASSDGPVLLDMPIYNQTSSDDLLSRAESMVSQEINRYFESDPGLAEIEIVVLGSRNGDVIPILATTVSRAQWQDNPQVSAWTKYYSAYALIRRHDRQPTQQVAAAPSRRSRSVASGSFAAQFDRQFDSAQLSGRIVQAYADLID